MEVSTSKSVVLASCSLLGRGLCSKLVKYGVKLAEWAKSLGAGMGAGVVRNTLVLNKRMKAFAKRARRFRLVRRNGVGTARLMRTGGLSSLTYGAESLGVSDSMLLNQRRVVAAAVAPSSGGGGQDLDMSLVIADGGVKGMADPAYPAHTAPMGHWAMVIWYGWLPLSWLQKSLASGRLRLAVASVPWSVVKGPAAAFVASAARLKWTVVDVVNVIIDSGLSLNLSVDPPAVVTREVAAAVRRWRNVERKHAYLDSGGKGS
jgi:hypothetical protein